MDGLFESMEFLITTQNQALRPSTDNPVDGYDGLADPRQIEIFLEIDHVGTDAKVPHKTVEDMASRFSFEKIKPRFDDGYLGGGGPATPSAEQVTLDDVSNTYKNDPSNFRCERGNYFHYAAFVDRTKGTFMDLTFRGNGRADRPGTTLVICKRLAIYIFFSLRSSSMILLVIFNPARGKQHGTVADSHGT